MLSSAACVHYLVNLACLKGIAEPVLIEENESSLLRPTFTFLFRWRHVTTVVIIRRKRGGTNGEKSGGGQRRMDGHVLNKLKAFIQESAVCVQCETRGQR